MTLSLFALSLAAAGQAVPMVAAEAPATVVQQQQNDPALLINRAVVLARMGRDEEARALFETVRRMKVDYTLETQDGRWVYPPDLARQGLRQLDRGEFRNRILAARD